MGGLRFRILNGHPVIEREYNFSPICLMTHMIHAPQILNFGRFLEGLFVSPICLHSVSSAKWCQVSRSARSLCRATHRCVGHPPTDHDIGGEPCLPAPLFRTQQTNQARCLIHCGGCPISPLFGTPAVLSLPLQPDPACRGFFSGCASGKPKFRSSHVHQSYCGPFCGRE
jgi:hypothetical protein